MNDNNISKLLMSLTFDDLMQYYISRPEEIRELILKYLKKRIDSLSKEELYNQIVDYCNEKRKKYLQSAKQSGDLALKALKKTEKMDFGLPEDATWIDIEHIFLFDAFGLPRNAPAEQFFDTLSGSDHSNGMHR